MLGSVRLYSCHAYSRDAWTQVYLGPPCRRRIGYLGSKVSCGLKLMECLGSVGGRVAMYVNHLCRLCL